MIRFVISILLLTYSTLSSAGWIHVTAKSWLVADGEGNVIQGEHIREVRSIASISKLMTVMVVLDKKQPLDEKVSMYTREQLIDLAIIHSDNKAAVDLCDAYPGGKSQCVHAMNLKARSLGLDNTRFIEPTGLSVWNVSTAEELIKVVIEASKYPEIVQASQMNEVQIKSRRRVFIFQNTNPIIGKKHKFIVSKTGYIKASGGCIVMMLDTDIGRRVVIVLGSKNTKTRIPEAEFITENVKKSENRYK